MPRVLLSKQYEGQKPGTVVEPSETRAAWLVKNAYGRFLADGEEAPAPSEAFAPGTVEYWKARAESAEARAEAAEAKPEIDDSIPPPPTWADFAELRKNYEGACQTIASMHEAAVGEAGAGPRRGVVEDVQDVSDAAHHLASAVIWMSGSRDFSPEGEAHEAFVKIRDNVLNPYLESSRGKGLSDAPVFSPSAQSPEAASTDSGEGEKKADDEKSAGSPEEGTRKPSASAPKGKWIEFAISKGETPEAAEAMTKDALVEKYGGE